MNSQLDDERFRHGPPTLSESQRTRTKGADVREGRKDDGATRHELMAQYIIWLGQRRQVLNNGHEDER